jgi:biopolymer transport protein ExbD
VRHRRRLIHAEGASSEDFNSTSIFITPMLDMTFQLLAFFILIFNPTALEGQFPITLAAGQEGGPKKLEQTPPPAAPTVTVTRPMVTVVAKARDRGGRLGSLEIILAGGQNEIIKGAEQAADANVASHDEEKETQLLLAQLEAKLLEYRQDDGRLIFQASQGMRWGDSMLAVDSCRQTTQLAKLQ